MLPQPVRRLHAAVLVVLLAAGCASRTSGKAEVVQLPPGRPIHVVSDGAPKFHVAAQDPMLMAAAAGGGLIGALIAVAVMKAMEGGREPAPALLAEDAMTWLRSRLIRNLEAEASLAAVQWIDGGPAKTAPDPVLTLTLEKWGLRSHRSDEHAFLPVLEVKATLVEGGERRWQGECEARTAAPPLPTLAELRANGHARLYRLMERALETCADELTASLVGREVPERRVADKREVKLQRQSLGAIETLLLGTREAPGLAAGRFEARFSDLTLAGSDLQTLQRLLRESMIGPGESELWLTGTLDGRPFEARLERNSAGRVRLKFDGLRFADEPEVDAFLDAFNRPGLRRVEFDGEAEGRRVKRSRR